MKVNAMASERQLLDRIDVLSLALIRIRELNSSDPVGDAFEMREIAREALGEIRETVNARDCEVCAGQPLHWPCFACDKG